MATTGKINGDNFLLYVNNVPMGHSIDATLEVSQELIDATTKDSSRWNDHILGNRSFSGSVSGLVAFDSQENAVDAINWILNGDTLTFKLSNSVSGDTEWSGSIDPSSVSFSAPQNSATGYDFSFQGKGALTSATIT